MISAVHSLGDNRMWLKGFDGHVYGKCKETAAGCIQFVDL